MAIKYHQAEDIRKIAEEIVNILNWNHIQLNDVGFLRSTGSSSRGTIARCHALGKAMQLALNRKGFYLIEIISERFDKLPENEKIKVIIHELMHIPFCFGGGFKHHNIVNEKNIKNVFEHYQKLRNKK